MNQLHKFHMKKIQLILMSKMPSINIRNENKQLTEINQFLEKETHQSRSESSLHSERNHP